MANRITSEQHEANKARIMEIAKEWAGDAVSMEALEGFLFAAANDSEMAALLASSIWTEAQLAREERERNNT